jgi:NIPSNAP
MKRLVEIRSYKLKPGSGPRFRDLVTRESLPLLRQCRMEVVAFGPSAHDPDSYFLMRAYDDLDHRRTSQAEFYASDAWRKGPRDSIVELIESDLDVVVWLAHEAVEAIRQSIGLAK